MSRDKRRVNEAWEQKECLNQPSGSQSQEEDVAKEPRAGEGYTHEDYTSPVLEQRVGSSPGRQEPPAPKGIGLGHR